jgi:hypothetical protein
MNHEIRVGFTLSFSLQAEDYLLAFENLNLSVKVFFFQGFCYQY